MTDAELVEALKSPDWRLRNLYWITDKGGAKVKFAPWAEQEKFLANLWFRNIILKARQRGFSTLIQLMMLDTCLFNANTSAAVIAQDQEAATVIFRKIKFAYDNLPQMVREMLPLARDSASELMLGNGSSLRVATSVRSATLQFLHVSEFGKICAKYPEKAREVLTGSLPAVEQNGIVCIESTAEGREGSFYDMVTASRALADARKALSKLDYRFHFAPWWDAKEYEIDPEGVNLTPKDALYFERMEGRAFTEIGPRKRAWYVKTRDTLFAGDAQMMRQEFPSDADEPFEASTEGVYLAEQLAAARREGRITRVPYDPRVPVNTFWDLGHGRDEMVVWFHQRIGVRDHWINYLEAAGEPFVWFVNKMQTMGYVWGKHFLPHDGNTRHPGAEALKTPADMLEGLGLRDIEIVPRISDVVIGIQQLRDAFPSYWFDEEKCAEGLRHLGLYRKEWNERLGVWSDRPRHDAHSHPADAIRQHGQGYRAPSSRNPQKRRSSNWRTA
jgi:hypothetical protein